MIKSKIYKICTIVAIFSLIVPFITSQSEESETLEIEIRSTGGDRSGGYNTNYIIYQDSEKTPYLEKNLESNPETITLPKDHKYKVEVFVNGMFTTVAYAELNEPTKLDISIPQSGGLKFNVYFERGEKTIDNATVIIKSNDGQQQAIGSTDENGDTMRYWLQSTNRDEDYYIAEVYYEEFLLATFSDIKIQHSIQQDQKLVVPIPAVVENLITFRLFDTESNQILKDDGNFSVLLVGKNNGEITNPITPSRGEIYFSSIPSDVYTVSVLRDGVKDPLWNDIRIPITGVQENFDLVQRDPLQPVSEPISNPIVTLDSEESEKLQIEVKSINGDRIGTFQTNYIIYQDSEKTPYLEKNLESNPETITLPKDHKYKVEIFKNGMYGDIGYVNLDESKKLNINIPQSGGLKFNVLFERGEKAMDNAIVIVKDNDGKQQAIGSTDENGDTPRFWLQSTNRESDFYTAEVYYDKFLLSSIPDLKIQSGLAQEQKIVVPIPAVVEELITFRLFDSELNKIVNNDANYSVLLTGQDNQQYKKSFISKNGEIFFSSIPSGLYTISVLKDGIKDPLWEDVQIPITGVKDNFDLNQISLEDPIVVPFSDVLPDPAPEQIPESNPGTTTNVIILSSEIYVPSTISVDLFDTVTWTNDDTKLHTVTSTSTGIFDSGAYGKNQTFSYQFTEDGTYEYFCELHPWMTGTVIAGIGGDVSSIIDPVVDPEVDPVVDPEVDPVVDPEVDPVVDPEVNPAPIFDLIPTPKPDPVIYYQESIKLSCNCVSFKLDNVQDFWLNKAQIELIKQFSKNNFPLTVGISWSTLGEDDNLMEHLKKGIQNNDLTIANHGLDNDILINLDKQKQSDIIKESTTNIFEEFSVTPKLFVPALYQFNDETKMALIENGYTHMSAGLETDTPPYPLQGESLFRFPSLAFTAEYNQSLERIVGISSEQTFSDVLNGIDTFGYAVITITPQEFSIYRNGAYQNVINRDQFSELKTLMEKIKSENIKVVEIEEINKNVSILEVPETFDNSLGQQFIPGWIKNTAGWWRDGHVDDNSFVQSIQFLIQEKIIQTSQTTQGTGNSEIPNWIKDTAGWWAEGLIPDNDFIFGVEYMIDNGIIAIQA